MSTKITKSELKALIKEALMESLATMPLTEALPKLAKSNKNMISEEERHDLVRTVYQAASVMHSAFPEYKVEVQQKNEAEAPNWLADIVVTRVAENTEHLGTLNTINKMTYDFTPTFETMQRKLIKNTLLSNNGISVRPDVRNINGDKSDVCSQGIFSCWLDKNNKSK